MSPDGTPKVTPPTGRPGRPRTRRLVPPRDVVYAMVHTLRRKGRVGQVTIRRVFGTARQVAQALARSRVSAHVNTSVVERVNATVRQHNSRKARKVYPCSKGFSQPQAMRWFALAYDNVCRAHLGLRCQEAGAWRVRIPAMAAGLSHHVWTLHEFMRYPLAHIPL